MTTTTLSPVILSKTKNLAFMAYIKQKSGFFAALRMTGVEVFDINK